MDRVRMRPATKLARRGQPVQKGQLRPFHNWQLHDKGSNLQPVDSELVPKGTYRARAGPGWTAGALVGVTSGRIADLGSWE